MSNIVRELNIQARLKIDDDDWPPEKPKAFTPLVLVHHQNQYNLKQSTAMTTFVQLGHIEEIIPTNDCPTTSQCHPKTESCVSFKEVVDNSKVTKDIGEILAPLQAKGDPRFILIEGAPGIGKSILLQEIAYRWGKGYLLKGFKLVLLLCLRDPAIQQIQYISHLFELFCRRDIKSSEAAKLCSDYFMSSNGEGLVFLIDGYDEFPENLQKSGLIADILNRKVLPLCGLVVSSRPHASVMLRQKASIIVDILGFTEKEREHYIQQTLQGYPEKIKELTQYLNCHLTISSLCFVPFNMVVLLYLYKLGIPLPKNSTELYQHFICLTICRHLSKTGCSLTNTITDLASLPEPCNKIINQLSMLSLDALNLNKLIFTLDEIKVACLDFETTSGAINGFGLLQAVQHFGLTGKTTTFNFLHLSIQEFLAAYYVTHLETNKQQIIIEKYFWSQPHFNMFAMYIALTKGQQPNFKQFLSGGNKNISISDDFLSDPLMCVRLYHCFREAGDKEVCKCIVQAKTFDNKKLRFTSFTLSTSDVECIAYFLTSSDKEWLELNLSFHYIQDHGLHILHRILNTNYVTITELLLSGSNLTASSSPFISDIVINCKVRKLAINGNETVGEELYSMLLDPNSVLEELSMYCTELSSNGAIKLFTTLGRSNKLKGLSVSNNNITDDACNAIAMVMSNTSLVSLRMWDNPISGEAILPIVQALQTNNTLELLRLPNYPKDIKKSITSIQTTINCNRKCHNAKLKVEFRASIIHHRHY